MAEDLFAPVQSDDPTSNGQSTEAGDVKRQNERSTILFPYGDLDDAIDVAKVIAGNYGSECTPDQLAAQLQHGSVTSGTFRQKLATARTFGVVTVSKERISLTELGRRIVQPAFAPRAKADAFLNVPLYKAIYEMYRGHQLPRDIAIENEMDRLGVARKQTDKARQAFQRSAEQAGFFAHGRDRLVLPALGSAGEAHPPPGEPDRKPEEQPGRSQFTSGGSGGGIPSGDGGGSGGLPPLNPFIVGLIQTLPPAGASWPPEKRKQWLQTAANILDLIYSD